MFRLLARGPSHRIVEAAYGTIVAQARLPGFYARCDVPDTIEGRFEMIVLHLALVLRRLRGEEEVFRDFGQKLFEIFCLDMDRSLREIGISDLGVPRHMRRVGEAFYGRARAYDLALASREERLAATLARNVSALPAPSGAAFRLAAYVRTAEVSLAGQSAADIGRGILSFPDPDDVQCGYLEEGA